MTLPHSSFAPALSSSRAAIVAISSLARRRGIFSARRRAPRALLLLLGAAVLSLPFRAKADTLISTQTYSYSGTIQSYTIPTGVNLIQIKAWGAGGGGAGIDENTSGGGGGFTVASYAVTQGQVVKVLVGSGGAPADSEEFESGEGGFGSGAGGHGAYYWGGNGGGGGGTQVNISNYLNVFAGGGGGSSLAGYGANTGGAGGGTSGQTGIATGIYTGGGGGSQSAGGSSTVVTGGSPTFGTAGDPRTIAIGNGGAGAGIYGWVGLQAGGGGGGYYGGGLGDAHQRPGGGGSGLFTTPNLISGSGATYTGNGATPAGTSDPSYPGGSVAYGDRYDGHNGYVVIKCYYSPPPVITSATSQTVARDQPLSYQITATNSPVSFGATPLPAGLSLNTTTGVISGSPTASGTVNTMLSATNGAATGTATLTWTILPPATLPDASDFEAAGGYSIGDLHGQQLWLATPSLATVSTEQAQAGANGLKLAGSGSRATATKYFEVSGSPAVTFIDLYARPVAETAAANSTLIQTESAQVGFQVAAGQGEVYVYDGAGANQWLATGQRFAINGSNQATGWLRLTIRADYTHHTWDLFVNGVMADYDLAFASTSESHFRLLTLKGDASAASYFDAVQAQSGNPLFTDADKDGMPDSWETASGLSTATDDRAGDHDGDGKSNIEEYFYGTAPDNADITPPTAPGTIHLVVTTPNSIALIWSGGGDTGGGTPGIAGYNLYRNGQKVNTSLIAGTGFTDTGLSAGGSYSYTPKAVDFAGNVSAASATFSAGTPASSTSGTTEVFSPLP
jgi:hypothetical protein